MKRVLIICFLTLASSSIFSQVIKYKDLIPAKSEENVVVKPLHSDKNCSSFIIQVKNDVGLHKHEWHSEQIYVLKGKAHMTINNIHYSIKKGDYLVIPEGASHSVKVTTKRPLKVISIQAPEFKGDDRIWL